MASTSTGIEWTDRTWNPVVGCGKVSPGCTHCYAETMAGRLHHMGTEKLAAGKPLTPAMQVYQQVTEVGSDGKRQWTGTAIPVPSALGEPLSWRKPQKIFVCSMSDLFHESVPFEYIAAVFAVMGMCSWHTFQVLTKRPERAAAFFEWVRKHPHAVESMEMFGYLDGWNACAHYLPDDLYPIASGEKRLPGGEPMRSAPDWPLRNVWLGTSAEDQKRLDERIGYLKQTPAIIHFLSVEPQLGHVHLLGAGGLGSRGMVDWVICGGESGPRSRAINGDWVRSLREQCIYSGTAFFFKQWGGKVGHRLLDGVEWSQFPGAVS